MAKAYDVFISYSQADARVAAPLEQSLKQFARRWTQRRALEVFRDAASLEASDHLWGQLALRLDQSRYAIAVLSPDAAASPWVSRELAHFIATHGVGQVLLALVAGEATWDDDANRWSPDSTAVPSALADVYANEPLWVDLRWTADVHDNDLTTGHNRFRDAVATLAAPIHGVSKDELEGEDVRAHRAASRARRRATIAVVVLLLLATSASSLALFFRDQTAIERSLREELEDVNVELAGVNVELHEANETLAVRNGQLDAANIDLAGKNEELDAANGLLAIANDALSVANDTLDAANTKLEVVNGALEKSNEALEDLNVQLVALEAFAATAAGQAICQGDYNELVIASSVAETDGLNFERWTYEMRDLAAAAIADSAATAETYEAALDAILAIEISVISTPPIPEPPDCSSTDGFPFRSRWGEITAER